MQHFDKNFKELFLEYNMTIMLSNFNKISNEQAPICQKPHIV